MNPRNKLTFIPPLALLLAGLWSGGCGHTEPARFYSLQSSPVEIQAAPAADAAALVMIEPVQVAQYLRRPQLILRKDRNILEYLDYDRWAAPLEEDVTEVLLLRLQAAMGGTAQIVPERREQKSGFTLRVKLAQLEADQNGQAHLRARWELNRAGSLAAGGEVVINQYAASSKVEDLVAAHQANLIALADRIASELGKSLAGSK